MNRYVVWTLAAVGFYWLVWGAVGTEWSRNAVAVGGIAIAFATFLRYLPNAVEKYRSDARAGEWRMLLGLELFWLGFGIREAWLLGGRIADWPVTDHPLNGFLAFWILCAGLLCFLAASEPVPMPNHQNPWVIAFVGVAGVLVGMIGYRLIWG